MHYQWNHHHHLNSPNHHFIYDELYDEQEPASSLPLVLLLMPEICRDPLRRPRFPRVCPPWRLPPHPPFPSPPLPVRVHPLPPPFPSVPHRPFLPPKATPITARVGRHPLHRHPQSCWPLGGPSDPIRPAVLRRSHPTSKSPNHPAPVDRPWSIGSRRPHLSVRATNKPVNPRRSVVTDRPRHHCRVNGPNVPNVHRWAVAVDGILIVVAIRVCRASVSSRVWWPYPPANLPTRRTMAQRAIRKRTTTRTTRRERIAGNNAKQTGNTARKDNVETMDEWMDGCEVRPGHRDIIGSKPHSLVGAVAPPVARLASPTRQAPSIHPSWQMAFRRVTKRRWWIHCAVTAVPHQISYGQTAVFDRGAIQAYQSRQCQQGSGRGSVQSERRCDSHPFSLCMVECGAAVHLSGSARSRQWTGHVTRYATHSSNELGRAGRAEQHHCPFGSLIIIIICCWKT